MGERHHNDGQEDASAGKRELPHGCFDDATTWSKDGMEKNREENEDYRQGHAHTSGQTDGADNDYDPPSDREAKKTYDEAWRESYDDTHKSSCFITSACVESAGLPDDCHELETLRRFRGEYVAKVPGGQQLIAEYCETAPAVVRAIDQRPDGKQLYGEIYREMVQPCVAMIESNKSEAALNLYRETFAHLRSALLPA